VDVVPWGEFATEAPDLARFGVEKLTAAPAYLATVRASGAPRVHPVTPIFADTGLYLFMEPTSPKGGDIMERGWFALHNGVPDNEGTGGEFYLTGRGARVNAPSVRSEVAGTASYAPVESHVLFELYVNEVRCKAYGDIELPATREWSATPSEK
jgi:hypothetical protein